MSTPCTGRASSGRRPANVDSTVVIGIIAVLLLCTAAALWLGYQQARRAKQQAMAAEAHARQAQAAAMEHAERAEAMSRFLAGVLTEADPTAPGDGVAKDLLARASIRVDEALADQPAAASRIRLAIGRAFLELDAFAAAEKQLLGAWEPDGERLADEERREIASALAALYETWAVAEPEGGYAGKADAWWARAGAGEAEGVAPDAPDGDDDP